MEEIVIIGGGVAGLSCLMALLDRGIGAQLIESGTIGSEKICGEFLAPPVVAALQAWEIGPIKPINQATFFGADKSFTVSFQQPAGGFARSEVELALAHRARQKGARILEQSPIEKIIPSTGRHPYQLYLRNGNVIEAKTAIFATGNFPVIKPAMIPAYYGFKIHFKQIVKAETLLMFSAPGAYLGFVPIAETLSNCAGLIKREEVEKQGSCRQYFDAFIQNNKVLRSILGNDAVLPISWQEGVAPPFGIKKPPAWPNSFWIGDAAASFYPAIGYGFAHSIVSAVMAAEFYSKNNKKDYQWCLTKQIKSKTLLAKIMNYFLQNPQYSSYGFPFLQANPWIAMKILKKLGYT